MSIETGRVVVFALFIILSNFSVGFSQDKVNKSNSASQVQIKQHEVREGTYVVIPPEKRKYSRSYRQTTAPRFFMTQVNVSPSGQNIVGDAANEPSIAVDPTNPNRIAIGWRQFNTVTNNFRQAGYGYTTNGGQTWTFPGVIEPGIFRSDPVLDADADGNFYYNSLTIESNNYFCDVFKSTDGGATWGSKMRAHGGDKQWMIIDKTHSIGRGNVYSDWTSYYSSCLPGFFTRGPMGGLYYENCGKIPGNPYWGTLAASREGELYTCGAGFVVAKSSTARDYTVPVTWDTTVAVDLDGDIMSGANPNPGGLAGQTWTAVDQTSGFVYLLCSVARHSTSDPLDIMFSRSVDGGLTWSSPRRVNDDTSSTAYQWFGTMSVAQNGRIDVVWLDTRDNPGTVLSSLYYASSNDFGVTWSMNERLSPSFDPHLGWPQQNKMGDYFHMVSDDSGAHLAWAATFNGEQDVYYGRIRNTSSLSTATFSENRHWNLVSVPLALLDYRKTSVFPTAISSALQFSNGSYVQKDTLTNFDGYWMRFDTAQSILISGVPITSTEVPVHQGWNLIGSLGLPIPTSSITSDPPGLVTSRFFGYDEGFVAVDTLQPGKGHWVKVTQDGSLTLSPTSAAKSWAAIHVIPTDELPPPAPTELPGNDDLRSKIPTEFSLHQNYPNPFNPATTILFDLKEDAIVTLRVYNTLGQVVAVLANRIEFTAGTNGVRFDASSHPSGVYYYKISAEAIAGKKILYSDTKKMLLTK